MDVRTATALAGGVGNVAAFCRRQGISRQTFYKWRARFAAGGLDGLVERSRRPHSSPGATAAAVEDAVARRRKELTDDGTDNGPDPIRWTLLADADRLVDPAAQAAARAAVPSRATIARLLTRRGLVEAAPQKRPKSSLHRFTYARPNECWQSDWTSWELADGTKIAIAGTLDDHSRYLAALRVSIGDGTGELVWTTMTQAIAACGVPARSLTDNGLVYSAARRGGIVAFEANLRALGVQTITSTPHHPQTCGKIERFWQTLKTWLRARDPAPTLPAAQALLDEFRDGYNTRRPHRALRGRTPAAVFAATPPARPASAPLPAPLTVSTTVVSDNGTVYVDQYQVNVGRRWVAHRVHVIRDGTHVVVFSGTRLVRDLIIDPQRRYQPTAAARYDLRGHREPHPTPAH